MPGISACYRGRAVGNRGIDGAVMTALRPKIGHSAPLASIPEAAVPAGPPAANARCCALLTGFKKSLAYKGAAPAGLSASYNREGAANS